MTRIFNISLHVVLIAHLFIFGEIARAQLSPGDLNNVHVHLDGLKNCEQCHEAGKQVTPAKCLSCHNIQAQKISERQGLHGLNDYTDCVVCHVEHLGRDSELIFWPDEQESFDHSLTGYTIEGKHIGLNCRRCHQPINILDKNNLVNQQKDLSRTFFGLTRACLNCHRDEHRGQLNDACLNCHNYEAWKPAIAFDHNKTDFALTGKHLQALCEKCHPNQIDNEYPDDGEFFKFTGIKHDGCNKCHEDTHKGKFGDNCGDCHNTAGWRQVNQAGFDHSRTNFPLKGKHGAVGCSSCHTPGKSTAGLRYDKCTACHDDFHRGQFVSRQAGGECDECHTVSGFIPVGFTIQRHNETKFPLLGSHLAIPCIACHKQKIMSENIKTTQFKFETTRCVSCHNDPHAGEADKYIQADGCEHCHNVESWRKVTFDHSLTKFALEGKHKITECRGCHEVVKQDISEHSIRFAILNPTCENCHKDIHQGQFAGEANHEHSTNCDRCHTAKNWFPDKFDHNQAAFRLEGAHQKIDCLGCHKKIMMGDREFTWFKPIEKSCEHCHGAKYTNDDLGDS